MGTTAWNFDFVHSHVGFTVRHLVVTKVKGQFRKWSGQILLDEKDISQSSVEVHIDAASIDTHQQQRDDHLRSADFFDVAKFPELIFKSRKVEQTADGEYKITGDLTIHGVTKEVPLALEYRGIVKSPWNDRRAGFTATTAIDRRDFGLTWNAVVEAGGVVVGDRIEIEIEIEATSPREESLPASASTEKRATA